MTGSKWFRGAVLALALLGAGAVNLACDAAPGAEANAGVAETQAAVHGATESDRVRNYLDSMYRRTDVRHAFKTRFKEDVDCVDAYAQPSLKDPLLRNHVIATPPALPHAPSSVGPPAPPVVDDSVDDDGNARRCPPGTVPIVRQTEERIRLAGGLDSFLRHAGKRPPPAQSGAAPVAPPASSGFFYAIGVNQLLPAFTEFLADATLAVYNPTLASAGDHTLSQMWLLSQGRDQATSSTVCSGSNCTQSLEAGWNVDTGLYGDGTGGNGNTHFFIFSTRDGYTVTGCYNLATTCSGWGHGTASGSGFVMWSGARHTPGQIIGTSSPGSNPVAELALEWFNPGPGLGNNWWLFANNYPVGYIPGSLFANGQGGTQPLTNYIAYYLAGGEVYDSAPGGLATTTDMGSGQFASTGFTQSAYQRNVRYGEDTYDGTGDVNFHDSSISPYTNDDTRYTESTAPAPGGSGWHTFFYFGGPGRTN